MQEYIKRYNRARTAKRLSIPTAILGLSAEAILIVIGTFHMNYFGLYVVLALITGIGGIIYYFASVMICGNKEYNLAKEISKLEVPKEEKMRIAAAYQVREEVIGPLVCSFEER